jgi:polysaccharide biosynthesis protein PslH
MASNISSPEFIRGCGRQCPIQQIAAGPVAANVPDQAGLVKLGYVADLREAFAAAVVFVNPLRMGTGVAIKMLDAMAAGMPCVSTRTGARGLGAASDAIEVVEDDDAADFSIRLIALLADPARRQECRVAARAAAERWNRAQMEALSALLAEPRRRSR